MIDWLFTKHEVLWTVVTVLIGLYVLAIAVGARLRHRRQQDSYVPMHEANFNDPGVRERMRDLLEFYQIRGSCDIRDGKVFVTRTPGERAALAAALMNLYRRALEDIDNPNLQLGYLKHGVFRPLGLLDIDSLREIAEQLENTLAH